MSEEGVGLSVGLRVVEVLVWCVRELCMSEVGVKFECGFGHGE